MNTSSTFKFSSLDELMAYCWAREFGYEQTSKLAFASIGHNLTEVEYANDYESRDRWMEQYYRANPEITSIDLI